MIFPGQVSANIDTKKFNYQYKLLVNRLQCYKIKNNFWSLPMQKYLNVFSQEIMAREKAQKHSLFGDD